MMLVRIRKSVDVRYTTWTRTFAAGEILDALRFPGDMGFLVVARETLGPDGNPVLATLRPEDVDPIGPPPGSGDACTCTTRDYMLLGCLCGAHMVPL